MQFAPLSPFVTPLTATTGTPVAMDADTGLATLASGTTYYYPLGNTEKFASEVRRANLEFVHVRWDSAAILTITFEDTGWTRSQVSDYDATAGLWVQENPTTAYVAASTGTVTNLSVAVAGGTAGGCTFHLGNFGAPRCRIKIVVGGTGGSVGVAQHGKA